MTAHVISPDVALHLAQGEVVVRTEHQLLAPTLLRSQTLSLLHRAVGRGELTEDAERRLDHVLKLRVRLLGDRVLRAVAWRVADQLGRPDTFDAEQAALTQLHADAFITLDERLAHDARRPRERRLCPRPTA